jgi:hypothetical protein
MRESEVSGTFYRRRLMASSKLKEEVLLVAGEEID